ncbi:39S ribosomal protein L42, mitochondrial [Sitophilus oryzae]|uniref:Large ribosomal subunit protein mL42 n=1 Tax=Sitophilus oryzae TaxID=7048 RepID=A0A6J2YT01_SITOR|nr:39S ribosomal protein L42, mitochondrial [Sitophilus oryzae]
MWNVLIISRFLNSKKVLTKVLNSLHRNFSSEHKIVSTKDESTLVAWHPKRDFPYEFSKPLPEEKIKENPSALKTQLTSELMSIFNKKTPEQARLELMNITHTTKHRWFPRARDKKAKKTPMDREYL